MSESSRLHKAPGSAVLSRRRLGSLALVGLTGSAGAAGFAGLLFTVAPRRSYAASSPAFAQALRQLTGGAVPHNGRVRLDIAPLVENGNTVPVILSLDSPMTPEHHVKRLALLTERNPQPEVAVFELGPLAARAQVGTRIRLATSQTVWALAELHDGSWWQHGVDVVVTLAACVEG